MLVVYTASADKTVARWSYSLPNDNSSLSFSLDFIQGMNDDILAIDVHPSGFYMLLSFNSQLRYCNIMATQIKTYHEDFALKGCKQLKFSNGGHFFAANDSTDVLVYQFYTATLLYRFSRHKTGIRNISWLDDDTCLASAASDYCINLWKVAVEEEHGPPLIEKNKVNFVSFALFRTEAEKGTKIVLFASANNGNVYIVDGKAAKLVYEAGSTFSQIVVMKGQRAIIGGTGDQS